MLPNCHKVKVESNMCELIMVAQCDRHSYIVPRYYLVTRFLNECLYHYLVLTSSLTIFSMHYFHSLYILAYNITVGASYVSEMLVECSLQVLDMSGNNIGDDGITAIARALSNCQISKLYVSRCGIALNGARSLAAGLLANNSVRILDVSGNPITVEGARLILQSGVDNGACKEVSIDCDYMEDDGVEKLNIILEQRKGQVV